MPNLIKIKDLKIELKFWLVFIVIEMLNFSIIATFFSNSYNVDAYNWSRYVFAMRSWGILLILTTLFLIYYIIYLVMKAPKYINPIYLRLILSIHALWHLIFAISVGSSIFQSNLETKQLDHVQRSLLWTTGLLISCWFIAKPVKKKQAPIEIAGYQEEYIHTIAQEIAKNRADR